MIFSHKLCAPGVLTFRHLSLFLASPPKRDARIPEIAKRSCGAMAMFGLRNSVFGTRQGGRMFKNERMQEYLCDLVYSELAQSKRIAEVPGS